MSYQLVHEGNGFIVTFYGDVSISEINEANGEIQGHAEFDTHRYQLIDFRAASLTKVTKEDSHEPAATDVVAATMNPSVRLALLSPDAISVPICEEFARESIELGSPWKYGIFYDYDAALEWARAGSEAPE